MRGLALSLRGMQTKDVYFLSAPVAGTETVPVYGSIVRLDEAKSTELFTGVPQGQPAGLPQEVPRRRPQEGRGRLTSQEQADLTSTSLSVGSTPGVVENTGSPSWPRPEIMLVVIL